MRTDEALVPVERGTVRRYFPEKGYGFVTTQQGGVIFFFISELLKAGYERVEEGVSVAFTRGLAKDGRLKIARFLEVYGWPAGTGTYTVEDRRLVLKNVRPAYEDGIVEVYFPKKGYGFALVGGRRVFIHEKQQGRGENASFVACRSHESAPTPVEGDLVRAVVVPGRSGTNDKASRWCLLGTAGVVEAAREVSASVEPVEGVSGYVVEIVPAAQPQQVLPPEPQPETKPTVVSAVPEPLPKRRPVVTEDWIDVDLRKLRKDRVSYADTDDFGQVQIPWTLFIRAGIKSLKSTEVLQVRLRDDSEEFVVTAVRRK